MSMDIDQIMGFSPQDLRLGLSFGEAASRWLRHRYPTHTAKQIARDAGIDPRTAENILAGHLSAVTITKLTNAYGWPFLAAVGAATLRETYEDSINRELEEIADERRRLDEMESGLRGRWAGLRARRAVDRGGLSLVPEEDSSSDRQDRRAG